jgi:hypothetical protein
MSTIPHPSPHRQYGAPTTPAQSHNGNTALPHFASVHVRPLGGQWYAVESVSRPGRDLWHTVDRAAGTCTCEAFTYRRQCPHLADVADWVREREEARDHPLICSACGTPQSKLFELGRCGRCSLGDRPVDLRFVRNQQSA